MFASNKKNIVLLLVSVGLGLLGALLAMLYLNAKEASLLERLKPKSRPVAVVVASRDLVKGDVLSTGTLSVREIPSEFVNNQTVFPDQFEKIEGLVLQENLESGKALLHSYINQDFPLDFSDTITEKRRAMTIQVDENNTFTGLLRPGNRIDLLVNKTEKSTGSKHVVPVLENVEVLTTGSESSKDYEEKVRILRGGSIVNPDTSFTTITVNVTAKEAAILNLALKQGELLALLRNRNDTAGTGLVSVDSQTIEQHAQELKRKEDIRRANEKLRANIVRGNDGILRNRKGEPLVNQNLMVGEDGKIRTAKGIDLTGRGLTLNEKGELIDKDGNVIDPDPLTIAADGSLLTADGRVLDGAKIQSLAGSTVEEGGVKLADGRLIAGATIDEDGNLVLADGTVVNADAVTIDASGQIIRADGTVVAGVTADHTISKIQVAEDGTLMLEGGTTLTGATLTEDGKLRLLDGTIVDPNDVLIRTDGSVVTKQGELLAGVNAKLNKEGQAIDSLITVDYIVGGVSKDSVATVNKVKVEQ